MVLNAFKDITDSTGLTRDTINEYVQSKFNIEEDCDVEVRCALKVLIKEGLVVQNSVTKDIMRHKQLPLLSYPYLWLQQCNDSE